MGKMYEFLRDFRLEVKVQLTMLLRPATGFEVRHLSVFLLVELVPDQDHRKVWRSQRSCVCQP